MKILYKLSLLVCLYVVSYSTYALGHAEYSFKNDTQYTVYLSRVPCQPPLIPPERCSSFSLTLKPKQTSYIFSAPNETDPSIIWKMQLKDKQNHTLYDNAIRISFKKVRNIRGGYNYRSSMHYTKFCKGVQEFVNSTINSKGRKDSTSLATMHITYKP